MKNDEKIAQEQLDIIRKFNVNPKVALQRIKEICEQEKINSAEQIAIFFHLNKKNLDLDAVGDYLGTKNNENEEVLREFAKRLDFQKKSILEAMRSFLGEFALPREGQQINQIFLFISAEYFKQNKESTYIEDEDAALLLALQILMLNTSLHNPNVATKDKLTIERFKSIMHGLNNEKNFSTDVLEGIYNDIRNKPFTLNFTKTSPGYELNSSTLNNDPALSALNSLLQSSEFDMQSIFPELGAEIKATVDKPKIWLNALTGYQGTITLVDDKTQAKTTVQIYTPNLISKLFFGEQPRVIIQPVYEEKEGMEQPLKSIELASKVAAHFSSMPKSIKATYDYELSDLVAAYDKEKQSATIKNNNAFKDRCKKREQDKDTEVKQVAPNTL